MKTMKNIRRFTRSTRDWYLQALNVICELKSFQSFVFVLNLKVDLMLGSFMEEMQITPEQFEVACLAGKQNSSLSFHQGLFQQVCNHLPFLNSNELPITLFIYIFMESFAKIWAANDIRIFIRMMTQKNVELQLQVLDVIERRHMNSTANSKDEESVDAIESTNVIINPETELEDTITQHEIE